MKDQAVSIADAVQLLIAITGHRSSGDIIAEVRVPGVVVEAIARDIERTMKLFKCEVPSFASDGIEVCTSSGYVKFVHDRRFDE